MTLCIVTGWQCNCQPDDGVTCTGPYELRQAYTHWRKLAEDRAEKVSELNSDLTAARLELENTEGRLGEYLRDNERLRWDISRLNMRCEAMGWMLYPHSDPPREAVAGDIGWPGTSAQTAYDRLQAALFRHACYCGCGDP